MEAAPRRFSQRVLVLVVGHLRLSACAGVRAKARFCISTCGVLPPNIALHPTGAIDTPERRRVSAER
jgi:hypothetical protein